MKTIKNILKLFLCLLAIIFGIRLYKAGTQQMDHIIPTRSKDTPKKNRAKTNRAEDKHKKAIRSTAGVKIKPTENHTTKTEPEEDISVSARLMDQDAVTGLNDRQKKIFSYLMESNESGMKSIKSVFKNITTRTLRRDLQKLVEKNLISKTGNTKSSRYAVINST